MTYQERLDKDRMPSHVAIIMDGNGRWAKARGLERSAGHAKGVEVVKKLMEDSATLGISYVTLYTFSTENWNRPIDEVNTLMQLLYDNIDEELFIRNQARLHVIGDMERIPPFVMDKMNRCIERTRHFDRLHVIVALSYSSRWEITEAVRKISLKVASGELKADEISENTVSEALTTDFVPDPELLIRTGGEIRLSNFLLWQSAYTELYFCDTYWPDFNMEELCKAIYYYQHRERRFGLTGDQVEESIN
ncbi:MAG: di-trans,poly-cis-decaprenylcistransferase [Bacteroidaceae bacterium]|nr:di-trans,poly-cis-decaprenylcistransferase [Bacteroidaceae bacterium]